MRRVLSTWRQREEVSPYFCKNYHSFETKQNSIPPENKLKSENSQASLKWYYFKHLTLWMPEIPFSDILFAVVRVQFHWHLPNLFHSCSWEHGNIFSFFMYCHCHWFASLQTLFFVANNDLKTLQVKYIIWPQEKSLTPLYQCSPSYGLAQLSNKSHMCSMKSRWPVHGMRENVSCPVIFKGWYFQRYYSSLFQKLGWR